MAVAPQKTVTVYGFEAKLEGSYNAGGSLSTSTDGIQLDELPTFTPKWVNSGARPQPPATMGYRRKVGASGRYVDDLTVKVAAKGAGVAYSASVVPNVHALLRGGGMDAALTTTGGLEKYVYTFSPGPLGYASLVAGLYGYGELTPAQALLADWSLAIDGPDVAVYSFPLKGLVGSISDASVPAITYPLAAIDAPKATNLVMTLGNMTTVAVRKLALKAGWQINPRIDINAGGHGGFWRGPRTPQLDVTFEAAGLVGSPFTGGSTMDPYLLYENGTQIAGSFQVGSVQYFRHKYAMPALQVMSEPKREKDGAVALWTVSFQLNPSADGLNDELAITFD